ncbi:hypothetical protein [Flavobacterium johnsoniae]|uniref:Uncharacterized protein n=1 Tax=Flavobacterium johnsoniae (strain ATCC 17061 / DSM 2064 / JCM 8514 / BCRC 14874 / CCUG 350202 / NBRC 14942 / NCIMB 11054 / UW101) TaxID=376686 RepID=A5FLG4_FLAJ1|nr:hypothetical protein [Flavobacterium johnsoniae]ABQ03957.1 hypothetical protein Fjoh_0923 [Flavobacterium johnsoniae UW101]OXE96170.1 hypothetical protein B0A63_21895 [Flavobacterium johnsoniae UW101]WQG79173.1 hypothetical protein SR927_14215 [Flavobacterium johnsoniae UW101]SHK07997.1 hypothetical protein SAMN05444146_0330 [Flavobacterium johnsoniae]
MEKSRFEHNFIEKLNKNYPKFSKYFEFRLEVFCEFNTLIYEINKCLILELDRAAITLTNHMLERLLKLTLIYNDVGIGPIEIDKWSEAFEEPNTNFGTIDLGNSIERCKKFGLISDTEKIYLFDTIRVLMRNGFSHADSSNILASLPDETIMFQGSLLNPNAGLKEVSINQKIMPTFQALQMEDFAKNSSHPYFDFVFNLIFKIENRLKDKFQTTE